MNMCHKRNFVLDKYVQSVPNYHCTRRNLVQPTQPLNLNNCVLTFDIIAYCITMIGQLVNPKQMRFSSLKITHKIEAN
jgi:hypothetical protein